MNKKGLATVVVGKFKSIQSVIFATVAFLVLCAVMRIYNRKKNIIEIAEILRNIRTRSSNR